MSRLPEIIILDLMMSREDAARAHSGRHGHLWVVVSIIIERVVTHKKEGSKKCPKTLRTNLLCSGTYKEKDLRNLGRHRAEAEGRLYMSLENNFSTGGGGSWQGEPKAAS